MRAQVDLRFELSVRRRTGFRIEDRRSVPSFGFPPDLDREIGTEVARISNSTKKVLVKVFTFRQFSSRFR